ncbi:hypothetical protein ElyMa_002759800 [Elysia marginata]|uniref:Uncharacterized protein n=1 Tax=Elysia marginata TaxID=1093978 RepID=A0AAV4HKV0_9GAST|nr:hypothetical protein ElyMa_002759800 [Elysia marginata]
MAQSCGTLRTLAQDRVLWKDIRFYALRARLGGRSLQRRKSKMADRLMGPVSQSSAVKPTLPMGVITSYVIVVYGQGTVVSE